ncbi:hypothetical protein HNQ59_002186 [Chitinivorax tropicus]|uniref:Squalene cyclase C-terminal domain-containing protein n=1 Tax=Chitinivorax tropicus TaxID=714531 RepID=A0A840MP77_9PROT|nr:hypothetical protein [Chitinivorax tropicus]MBB5018889.1 hypothetical protein [Chitinivorax tropicus]
MLTAAKNLLRDWRDQMQLTPAAKAEIARDKAGVPSQDPGIEPAVHAAIQWLKRAQDQSASNDGGVARDYSLIKGWGVSYPETTGYIIPTMIDYAKRYDDPDSIDRARRMLDWLVSIQFPEGGFMGGRINADVRVPVTFNTGQILLGLAAGVAEFGEIYRQPMRKAANWLRDSLDPDGCWRKHATPFAKAGDKTYETHVSWGLFEAARVDPEQGYAEAAMKQVNWALTQQQPNGWLANCCLTNPDTPLTHTLGYALRGFMEAHRFTKDDAVLAKAIKTADGLMSALQPDGFIPGMLKPNWQGAVTWSCLTGEVQIAHSWLMLYALTGETKYRDAAALANRYVRRTMRLDGPVDTLGAVKGSFPVSGAYGEFQYLNWAPKFMIDSNLLELDICHRG